MVADLAVPGLPVVGVVVDVAAAAAAAAVAAPPPLDARAYVTQTETFLPAATPWGMIPPN
jgi:hypothetical protein